MVTLLVAVATLTVGGSASAVASTADSPTADSPTADSPTASASPAEPYRVVGLGDSIPAGSACGCTSYVTLVGQSLAATTGRTASIDNLARGGATTDDVADQLAWSDVRAEISDADLVIVTIGANDFDADIVASPDCAPASGLACYQRTLAQQRSTLATVLAQIRQLQAAARGRLLVTGYWNVFLDGEVGRGQGAAYVTNSDALTVADNALIASVSAAGGATYVDVYTPFKGSGSVDDTALLAADGDHPDAAGHRLIAEALLGALSGDNRLDLTAST
jgi:lysophospholipase L1-like esterase